MPEPWTRQADEGHEAWAFFVQYREMGAERSLAKLGQATGKDVAQLERWSSRYYWQMRVAEFDRYLDRQRVDDQVQAIIEMNRRHAGLAVLMQQKVLERVTALDPQTLSARDAARWIEVATNLERLSRGATTELVGSPSLAAEAANATLADFFAVPVELSAEERLRVGRAVYQQMQGPLVEEPVRPATRPAETVAPPEPEPDPKPIPEPEVPVVPARRAPRGQEAKDARFERQMRGR